MSTKESRHGVVGLLAFPPSLAELAAEHLRRARFGACIVDDTLERNAVQAVLVDIDHSQDPASDIHFTRARHPGAAIVAWTTEESGCSSRRLVEAFRAGAQDAVIAADGPGDLLATIRLAVEKRRIEGSSSKLAETFTRELGLRTRRLQEAYGKMESAYEDTLHALVQALDTREKATAHHSMRVAYYTCYLALAMELPEDRIESIYRGALLHDIGKIGIPDAILLKPAKLDAAEWTVMRSHTTIALDFLSGIDYLKTAVDIPYSHHEKWNGQGYPRGLAGTDIPQAARIFAVADVFDALRSRRSYKEPFPYEDSVAMILADSGTHFDPEVVAVFAAQDRGTWDRLDAGAAVRSTFSDVMAVCREALATATRSLRLVARNEELVA